MGPQFLLSQHLLPRQHWEVSGWLRMGEGCVGRQGSAAVCRGSAELCPAPVQGWAGVVTFILQTAMHRPICSAGTDGAHCSSSRGPTWGGPRPVWGTRTCW